MQTLFHSTILWLLVFGGSQVFASQNKALLIGIKDYEKQPLANSVRDVQVLGEVLEALDFSVNILVNADEAQLKQALLKLARETKLEDRVLIYYTGHGTIVDGDRQLIPVDVDPTSKDDLRRAVSVSTLMDAIEEAGQKILILDTCYSGNESLDLQKAPTLPGLSEGWFYFSSASPGQSAYDGGPGGHSVFTGSLLSHLRGPKKDLVSIAEAVQADVALRTSRVQMPMLISTLREPVYLTESLDRFAKSDQVGNLSATDQKIDDIYSKQVVHFWVAPGDNNGGDDFLAASYGDDTIYGGPGYDLVGPGESDFIWRSDGANMIDDGGAIGISLPPGERATVYSLSGSILTGIQIAAYNIGNARTRFTVEWAQPGSVKEGQDDICLSLYFSDPDDGSSLTFSSASLPPGCNVLICEDTPQEKNSHLYAQKTKTIQNEVQGTSQCCGCNCSCHLANLGSTRGVKISREKAINLPVMICILMLMGFITLQLASIRGDPQSVFWIRSYAVLIFLALLSSLVCFGILDSSGELSGNAFGLTLTLGGAAACFVGVLHLSSSFLQKAGLLNDRQGK